jgi:hypothetical protein
MPADLLFMKTKVSSLRIMLFVKCVLSFLVMHKAAYLKPFQLILLRVRKKELSCKIIRKLIKKCKEDKLIIAFKGLKDIKKLII